MDTTIYTERNFVGIGYYPVYTSGTLIMYVYFKLVPNKVSILEASEGVTGIVYKIRKVVNNCIGKYEYKQFILDSLFYEQEWFVTCILHVF